ncbi:MAG: Tyrosine recombinase XerC [Verrucomicrobiae bacterium]|nr:Tyrosine recombinase XerC [Verrucomicrobiae bacterium]
MTTTKTKTKLWPPIHELSYTNGKTAWQVACMVNGQRIREAYPTKKEAEDRATEIRNQVENEGRAAFTMPTAVRVEATKAIALLKPHNASITEAVEHYVEHVLKYRTAPTVSEIVKLLVAEAEGNKRRDRTVKDLRMRLEQFAKSFGDRQLASITREELTAWLNDPTLSARSRINYAVKVSQLYNFAIRNGWAEYNIAASIPRPTAEDAEPEIFTADQAARLLEHAAEYELLPYVAIGLFAGLRSAELLRLDWSAVKLAERSIIIGANVAKKRSRRVVEINDTLAAWLASCTKRKGMVVEHDQRTLYKRLTELATAAGLEKWQDNGLRHSCASYSLALTGDAVKVAYQLGNSADMIHRHYKALVTAADAKRFFELRPAADEAGNKIVPMVANS